MTDWTRRELVKTLSAVVGGAALAPALTWGNKAGPKRPRSLIQIFLPGGVDAVLTTDPKTRGEVNPVVDIPYAETEIHAHGKVRVGPLWNDLKRHLPELAILNGVVCSTVSHMAGAEQIYQMSRVLPPMAPGLVANVGRIQPGALLESVRIHFAYGPNDVPFFHPRPASPLSLNLTVPTRTALPEDDLLQVLWRMARDPARGPVVEGLLALQTRGCQNRDECLPVESTRALLLRLRDLELPPPVLFPLEPATAALPDVKELGTTTFATLGRDILFLLANHVTHGIVMPFGTRWDSHSDNLSRQRLSMRTFAPFLAGLLDLLKTNRDATGTLLSDQVGVVVSSELGRFPILNRSEGKDHFPELPMLFWGPGIRPGQYGETDRNMIATPISFQTGAPTSSAGDRVPNLDDVGRTIMNWFGEEDAGALGYVGRRLDFLLA